MSGIVETDKANHPAHVRFLYMVAVLMALARLTHPIKEFGGLVAGPRHGTSVEYREDMWFEKKITCIEYVRRSVILLESNQFDMCTSLLVEPDGF